MAYFLAAPSIKNEKLGSFQEPQRFDLSATVTQPHPLLYPATGPTCGSLALARRNPGTPGCLRAYSSSLGTRTHGGGATARPRGTHNDAAREAERLVRLAVLTAHAARGQSLSHTDQRHVCDSNAPTLKGMRGLCCAERSCGRTRPPRAHNCRRHPRLKNLPNLKIISPDCTLNIHIFPPCSSTGISPPIWQVDLPPRPWQMGLIVGALRRRAFF